MGKRVLGIEADAAWADVGATFFPLEARIRAMGTVRGRVGYAFDQVLIYGTGGYAWADNRFTFAAFSDSKVHSGWTVGAGVEVMFAPKWSVKADYLYPHVDTRTYFPRVIPG